MPANFNSKTNLLPHKLSVSIKIFRRKKISQLSLLARTDSDSLLHHQRTTNINKRHLLFHRHQVNSAWQEKQRQLSLQEETDIQNYRHWITHKYLQTT